jgi:hypothetical protein
MKTQKQVQVIERTEIKRTGLVLYEVLSSNGVDTHYVTIKGTEVFCTCKGFEYGKCYHSRELLAAECELVAEAKMNAYRTCYDDMAAEKTASIEAVKAAYAKAQTSGIAGTYKASWYR